MNEEHFDEETAPRSRLERGQIWLSVLCLGSSLFCGVLWMLLLFCPQILHAIR